MVRLSSIEPRTLNLFVKPGKEKKFKEAFSKAFGEDFILLTKAEVYESGLFGTADRHSNADGMLGDYKNKEDTYERSEILSTNT